MNRNRKKAAAATLAAGMAVVLGAGTVMAAASTGDNGVQKEETVSDYTSAIYCCIPSVRVVVPVT